MNEPQLRVGIMYEPKISFTLNGIYILQQNGKEYTGRQDAFYINDNIAFDGFVNEELIFYPKYYEEASFDLFDVTIGIKFHWERKEDQRFKGALHFICEDEKLTAINVLSLEDYLISVISSEMSATSSMELLKAHAIISRSWLIAQVIKGAELQKSETNYQSIVETDEQFIRWYDREDHVNFDVCADDHCQRYQGITKQSTQLVVDAINATRGLVLTSEGEVCDARFSKCCGGVAETFENVWEPENHKYLQAVIDNPKAPAGYDLNLKNEAVAGKWIRTSPEAFCNTTNKEILSQVLNDYDQETMDFYRWKVEYTQDVISELIARKTGKDFGQILDLIPVERGESGRLIKLKIVGSKRSLVIGKELEIRKVLSESHLYSSEFVVDKEGEENGVPAKFILIGAGWGHGVGLCQIGAAVMGAKGYKYDEILLHYFRGAELEKRY
ncbi:SpoIID/LytB domain-containing protein [Labilibaculum sp. K2S]|uniref:SpoIID/LytB domain-containing protein n=1 Tax=Labilibaculum sp. K2S TaxID=3056386 RepID=UPI0025A47DDD|nr:SpoIID/LytB domain-containing protein [Labilibaculum sp. K2S]MDM8160804.1 SpoIID/LytB domain-containing protein [Labilibaculum sp. K2S]